MTGQTTDSQPSRTAPRCHRHPQVETWVSCGGCGRPLCPDCIRHGPVGIRCEDCLYPAGRGGGMSVPQSMARASMGASIIALAWVVALAAISVATVQANLGYTAPNLFVSGLAGGVTGWLYWRMLGKAWNSRTRRTAIILGLLIPLAASLVITAFEAISLRMAAQQGLVTATYFAGGPFLFALRSLVAAAASTLFAWLLSTQPD